MKWNATRRLGAIGAVLALGMCAAANAQSVTSSKPATTDVKLDSACTVNGTITLDASDAIVECRDKKWEAPAARAVSPASSKVVMLTVTVQSKNERLASVPLVLRDGKSAHYRSVTQGTYVSDVGPCKKEVSSTAGGGLAGGTPPSSDEMCVTTSPLVTGLEIAAEPHVLENRDVVLDLKASNSQLISLENVTNELGTVQIPKTYTCGFESAVRLKPDVDTVIETCSHNSMAQTISVLAKVVDRNSTIAQ
ncbi:hypothetical protein KDX16_16235 [Burkholderia vietnamiensis]|jgi:hypothetical protein|uniref:Uncharacterized protein n=1 Tax=Burkholderia aenigmatica TaxID=2015348 RepID=A0A6P2ST14_9BURK|nr:MULTISPECIES: hypothetical protein [Burkholderia cepacia complex]HDR9756620.1 hypothetical protein [Burkholderia cepacia ATCC 25416]MBR7917374.1 hypothetical protein [Burkholderia vietnamiensis]MBR8054318.1 hypothetical protein [Burkholderia vietnamiensis]VWC52607.1 hypothetical protein BLA13014_08008 [Burkholderia aenigmatica]HDR9789614.1 hypothetical protein [Burkholderia cepacia ATCC 25416]